MAATFSIKSKSSEKRGRLCRMLKGQAAPSSEEGVEEEDEDSFLGGRHKDDKGLYVSTGGFFKGYRYKSLSGAVGRGGAVVVLENNSRLQRHTVIPRACAYFPEGLADNNRTSSRFPKTLDAEVVNGIRCLFPRERTAAGRSRPR